MIPSQYGATRSTFSEYVIDLKRGIVTHSSLMGQRLWNRYFRTEITTLRPDLSPAQSQFMHFRYAAGEQYLIYLHHQTINQLYQLSKQSSMAYLHSHRDLLDKNMDQLKYPIRQIAAVCFVRTNKDRQMISNRVQSIMKKMVHYGMSSFQQQNNSQIINQVTNQLRNRLYPQKQIQSQ